MAFPNEPVGGAQADLELVRNLLDSQASDDVVHVTPFTSSVWVRVNDVWQYLSRPVSQVFVIAGLVQQTLGKSAYDDQQKGTDMEWEQQGQRLRQLREATGMSRHRLGVAIGRTSQTVLNWEQGKIRPPIEMIVQLGDVLDAKAELIEAYGYTADASMKDRLREAERRIDEQSAIIERLIKLVGLEAAVTADEVDSRRRRKS